MSELTKEEAVRIYGGVNLSGTIVNAFLKGADIILELGRSLGSAIRRIQDHNVCPYQK